MQFNQIVTKLSTYSSTNYENAEILNQFKPKTSFLPIEKYSREFLETFNSHSIIILIGETGSGKTTKIPQILLESNPNIRIAHILPRKIACISIASYIAKNMNTTLGEEIGYSIRFDYNYSKKTKVKFWTEGMFLREALADPWLREYSTIIIDDCHEKSINTELILALVKWIHQKRKQDFKIIISSATIDYAEYMKFFGTSATLFYLPGRIYPVDIYYLTEPTENYWKTCLSTAMNIHKNNPTILGDILMFLPGMEEINEIAIWFEKVSDTSYSNIIVYKLSASFPTAKTLEIFSPISTSKRKLILSTNIAEASITIDNIGFVIDSCYTKLKYYNHWTDCDHTLILPSSKTAWNQRAGRAGRTRPGQCYRMITESDFNKLDNNTMPEIQRSNWNDFIVTTKAFGIKHWGKWNLITPLNKMNIVKSLETLFLLNVIDKDTNWTPDLGSWICDIPINVHYSTALIYSGLHNTKFNCTSEVLAIVSMLSVNNLFNRNISPEHIFKAKQSKGVIEGDHLTLLSWFKIFKSIRNTNQRQSYCKDLHLNYGTMKEVEQWNDNIKNYLIRAKITIQRSIEQNGDNILKCFLKGFIWNIAKKDIVDNSYTNIYSKNKMKMYIHPSSVLYNIQPEYIVYDRLLVTKKAYMENVSSIKKEWIYEIGGNIYLDKTKEINADNPQSALNDDQPQAPQFIKTISNWSIPVIKQQIKLPHIPTNSEDNEWENITMLRRKRNNKKNKI